MNPSPRPSGGRMMGGEQCRRALTSRSPRREALGDQCRGHCSPVVQVSPVGFAVRGDHDEFGPGSRGHRWTIYWAQAPEPAVLLRHDADHRVGVEVPNPTTASASLRAPGPEQPASGVGAVPRRGAMKSTRGRRGPARVRNPGRTRLGRGHGRRRVVTRLRQRSGGGPHLRRSGRDSRTACAAALSSSPRSRRRSRSAHCWSSNSTRKGARAFARSAWSASEVSTGVPRHPGGTGGALRRSSAHRTSSGASIRICCRTATRRTNSSTDPDCAR